MIIRDTFERRGKETIMKSGLQLLEKNPEKNIDNLFNLIKKGMKGQFAEDKINYIHEYYKNNQHANLFIQDIFKNTHKNCLTKFFTNFIGNQNWYGISKRAKVGKENDTKIPYTILLSPSMRCNLRCTGCYAANYSKKDDLPLEEVDKLIREARDLGIYFVVILGGEPFINEYMLDIYKKYDDMYFVPFTNGTLFNENLVDKLQDLGNVMPMFSLEGWEEDTDERRGKGTFNAVMNGMDLLKERGIPFGVSSATSNSNMETVTSDAFIDMLIEKGSRMSWYFMFMPVGDEPVKDMKYMLSPEERINLGRRTRKIRTSKPYFTIDFFNDAPYVGGCIAGKYYCHINSKGDLEPCIFSHFAADNIKEKSLLDGFKAPYFKAIRKRQPYNKNLLRPCMMIDNPSVIREIIAETGAYATHPSAELMIKDPIFMEKLDKLAKEFKPIADKAFEEDFNNTGNYELSRG